MAALSLSTSWLLLLIPLTLWTVLKFIEGIFRAMKSTLPGPNLAKWTTWWMRWQDLGGIGKRVEAIHRLHGKYGPIVQIGPQEISFCHADALRAIYKGPRGLDAGPEISALQQYNSENVVSTVDSDLHAARRRCVAGLYSGPTVATPAFQDTLKTFIDRFMAAVEENAAKSPSRTVNVFPWIKWLTSDVMVQRIFGPSNSLDLLRNEDSKKRFKELITTSAGEEGGVFMSLISVFPKIAALLNKLQPPPKINAFGMKCVREEITDQELPDPNLGTTHLQHLLSNYKNTGPSTTIPNTTYIASDCLDHFFAGSTTTTDLISAAIWRLSLPENEAHQKHLRQELLSAEITGSANPDLSSTQQLPFLTNILRETLRMDPPIPVGLPRVVKEHQNIEVMGVKIQPDTLISVPVYSLHRDPEIFPDPETWNPDRWSLPVTSPAYKSMLRNLIPFGTGARMCTGMNVAWAETRLLIARIYSGHETRLDRIWLDGNGALLPKQERKSLYPATVEEPIEFRKL